MGLFILSITIKDIMLHEKYINLHRHVASRMPKNCLMGNEKDIIFREGKNLINPFSAELLGIFDPGASRQRLEFTR